MMQSELRIEPASVSIYQIPALRAVATITDIPIKRTGKLRF